MVTLVIVGVIIALMFSFLNGMNDSGNSIATVVGTRVLTPNLAVLWAAFWNFVAIGVFHNTTVARTMISGIVDLSSFQQIYSTLVIFSALLGAVIWVFICAKCALPISVSHALIGGLIGPVWFSYGAQGVIASGVIKIVVFIVVAPLMGFIFGFIIMALVMLFCKNMNRSKLQGPFKIFQVLSSGVFSLGHGGNDAQKTIGVITMLLASAATPDNIIGKYLFDISLGNEHFPLWVVLSCYTIISLGTILGGKRTIMKLGDGLAKLHPEQGFSAEFSGAITLAIANIFGIPISTTHTITGSIIGVGSTKGLHSVKWATAANIVTAWIFTIPATIVIAGLVYLLLAMFI